MTTPRARIDRLREALAIAERVGNTFMAANIKAAIREEQRLNNIPPTQQPPPQ